MTARTHRIELKLSDEELAELLALGRMLKRDKSSTIRLAIAAELRKEQQRIDEAAAAFKTLDHYITFLEKTVE